MADLWNMDQVKVHMNKVLMRYSLESRGNSTHITTSVGNISIAWDIENANAKRFEVTLSSDEEEDFNEPAAYDSGRYKVFNRFKKNQAGAEAAILWIAKAKKSHDILNEFINPSVETPNAHFFSSTQYRIDDDVVMAGVLISAKVLKIICVDGVMLKEPLADRTKETWFMLEVRSISRTETILYKEHRWHPVHMSPSGPRIFQHLSSMHVLKQMNSHGDEALINAAISHYLKMLHDDPTEE